MEVSTYMQMLDGSLSCVTSTITETEQRQHVPILMVLAFTSLIVGILCCRLVIEISSSANHRWIAHHPSLVVLRLESSLYLIRCTWVVAFQTKALKSALVRRRCDFFHMLCNLSLPHRAFLLTRHDMLMPNVSTFLFLPWYHISRKISDCQRVGKTIRVRLLRTDTRVF